MKRPARLEAAKTWIPTYEGKRLVKGYSKYFGVDKLCAVKELEMLGYPIDDSYKKELREARNQQHQQKLKRKRIAAQKQAEIEMEESDETFAYIAGYTSGGAPYGITWEEMTEIDDTNT